MGPRRLQPLVQLQVDMWGEVACRDAALGPLGTRGLAKVGLEGAGAAEALVAYPALGGPLAGVHGTVLLQVGQLREAPVTQRTPERALPAVHAQVDLEVGELPEALATQVALV